ncbi:uncharacterized protein LOC100905552 [Galendromus occidentalis]|uniref:Uncharacterized protein LOC100905552 n=1 Tax=Galendromus occidentalis TaxID=34638 RepID=A0AAJ6W0U4_9ACAR|nr:uncharacterized protein LOC100905552 [Galendromus occidentalis]
MNVILPKRVQTRDWATKPDQSLSRVRMEPERPIRIVEGPTGAPEERRPVPPPEDVLNSAELPKNQLSPEEIAQLRLREIQQFKTRFPKSVSEAEGTYSFTFSSTDPDWAFDVRSLRLKVNFPPEYPTVPLSIVVVNDDDVLPPLLVQDVDEAILEWIKFFHKPDQLSFRPFLRWIDRNLQEIFVESLRKIKKLQERPLVVFVDQENLSPSAGGGCSANESSGVVEDQENQEAVAWPTKALPKKQKRLEELDDLFDASVKPKPEVQKVAGHGPLGSSQLSKIFHNYDPHTPPRRGIEVKFRHVDFSESVSFVVCDRLLVSVQCKKCKKIADFQLVPGKRSVSPCAKCQTKLEACFGPAILFQFNPLLGYLELKECTIRDVALSRCHFYADCLNCTKLSPLEGVHLGQRGSSHCLSCNVKMTFVMDSFKYMDMCAIEANIRATNLKKANKDSAIQSGKPLPSNGACKHYKKSFRWFRFPCCGKAYPCDDCHDVAEDHEAEFASRMICGFCAKEQPFSNDKPCSQCSNMITGRRTAHWEGGKGCRSQLKMSSNDSKKFAGLSKTVSRKSTVKSK